MEKYNVKTSTTQDHAEKGHMVQTHLEPSRVDGRHPRTEETARSPHGTTRHDLHHGEAEEHLRSSAELGGVPCPTSDVSIGISGEHVSDAVALRSYVGGVPSVDKFQIRCIIIIGSELFGLGLACSSRTSSTLAIWKVTKLSFTTIF